MNLDQSYLRNMSAMVVVFNFQSVQSPVEIYIGLGSFKLKTKVLLYPGSSKGLGGPRDLECWKDLVGSRILKALGRSEVLRRSARFRRSWRSARSWRSKRSSDFKKYGKVEEIYEIYKIWEVSISRQTRKIKRSTSSINFHEVTKFFFGIQ